jgi:hypothetical protein
LNGLSALATTGGSAKEIAAALSRAFPNHLAGAAV